MGKTAKRMFEELGYELRTVEGRGLNYILNGDYQVAFDIKDQSYLVFSHLLRGSTFSVSNELHAAIHQQRIELGWEEKK